MVKDQTDRTAVTETPAGDQPGSGSRTSPSESRQNTFRPGGSAVAALVGGTLLIVIWVAGIFRRRQTA
jgi:hypothetical protein